MDALEAVLTDRPVAYHPILADVGGSANIGLYLSQLLYWSPRAKGPDGWFYKTETEMQAETRLTRRNQESGRKRLVELGVLEVQRRGVPATLYFKLDIERLAVLIEQCAKRTTSLAENAQLVCTEAHNLSGGKRTTSLAENAQLLKETEITTETTPEITTENAEAPETKRATEAPVEAKHFTTRSDRVVSWPEWFQPITKLEGFVDRDYSKQIKVVEDTCSKPEVNLDPRLVVSMFVEFWTLNRVKFGWTDPGKAFNDNYAKDIGKLLRMPESERKKILVTPAGRFDMALAGPPPVPCEVCNGQGFYRVSGAAAHCDHSGHRKDRVAESAHDLPEIWHRVLQAMELQLPRPTFATWLAGTQGLSIDGTMAIVLASSPFAVEWLERRMYHALEKALNAELGEGYRLVLVWEGEGHDTD